MKVGIIGAGSVGSSTAFALVLRGVADEIVLIDINQDKALAEATDISHAIPFSSSCKIMAGEYADLNSSDVVVITSGVNQQVGETRLDLLSKNVKIFSEIIPNIVKHAPNTILLIATNPVDVMTEVSIKLSGFAKSKVIGSGTVLDTARFRTLLGYYMGISPTSIHANVLGEHGDSEVLVWSNGDIGTLNMYDAAKDSCCEITSDVMDFIDDNVRNAAYKIINGKGYTNYGIAGVLARICQAISSDERAILTVSSHQDKFFEVQDICLSLPCIVGEKGINNVLHPQLNEKENIKLSESAKMLKYYTEKALLMLENKL